MSKRARLMVFVLVPIAGIVAVAMLAKSVYAGRLDAETFPRVRSEAEAVMSAAGTLGLTPVDVSMFHEGGRQSVDSRHEMLGWFDPFCGLLIPANRLSVVSFYRVPVENWPDDITGRYQEVLEQQGWSFTQPSMPPQAVGWKDRYRVQLSTRSVAGDLAQVIVEVRNEDRNADGCFK